MRVLNTMFHTMLLVVVMLSAFILTSQAAVPQLINYQGRLTNAGGTAVPDGNYSVVFTIYDAPSGGTVYWTETQSVTTTAGLFSVLLGTMTPVVDPLFYSTSRYLGIKVGTDPELTPRTRFVSSPYACRVASVEGTTGGTITGVVSIIGAAQIIAPAGLTGFISNASASSVGQNEALYGVAQNSTSQNIGVYGVAHDANGVSNSAGIYGTDVSDFGGTVWAGYFDGWATVTGNFYAGAKFFKIDDPVDPANRTLQHACVESNEFKNMYDGVVTTNASGNATVTLPSWFEALNKDFRYQLTVIGQFAQAIVSGEIANSSFSISTDKPNVKVSWLITGVRKDQYALAHPFDVEQDKPAALRGKYLHPIENGVDEKLGVDYATRQLAVKAEKQAADRMKPIDTSASSQR